jgi:hypothetical protein
LSVGEDLGADAHLVGEAGGLGGADGSQRFWDLAVGQFSEIHEAVLAELEVVSACGGGGGGAGDLREAGGKLPGQSDALHHHNIIINKIEIRKWKGLATYRTKTAAKSGRALEALVGAVQLVELAATYLADLSHWAKKRLCLL